MPLPKYFRIGAALLLLAALLGASWLLADPDLARLLDPPALKSRVAALGAWGPLAIIGLMVLAILASPIPSAPVAMAAGALYGHAWGTLYVLLGAEIGAIAAFLIARTAGRDLVERWLGARVGLRWLGSQNALMGIVFASRLVPFISFDAVSYAAGLTALSLWRFALATLAGIVPASFLLAHFGGELAEGDGRQALLTALVLGLIVALPLAGKLAYEKLRERKGR